MRHPETQRFCLLSALAMGVLAGCGSSSHPAEVTKDGGETAETSAGGSHDGGADAPPVPLTKEYDALPSPPLLQNLDGGFIASPTIVAIFFANDDPALLPQLEDFYMGLGTSPLWKAAKEYGVGAATAMNVVLTEDAPATIDDSPDTKGDTTALESWLLAEIASGKIPAHTANTIYMINYPAGTAVTADGTQCVDFDGYHTDVMTTAGTLNSYGVIPRCTDQESTTLITFTSKASHEAIECATNPYPDYEPAWAEIDIPHIYFDLANDGSEIADMCEQDPETYQEFPGFPFTVQRIWSNEAVLAGHDPCVPEIAGKVFFNAVPELPDTGLLSYQGNMATVDSIHIPVGETRTVYLDLYSDGATADWDVLVLDINEWSGGDPSKNLLTLPSAPVKGNNGSRIPISFTVKTAGNAATNGEPNNTELFAVASSIGTGASATTHYWYGIVTN